MTTGLIIRKSAEVVQLEQELKTLSDARTQAVQARDAIVNLKLHLDNEWARVEHKLRMARAEQ